MSRRRKISATLQQHVRQRALFLCEYCHASEQWQYVRFTVDHVVPLALGGDQSLNNLALACFHCNRRKADKLVAFDPSSLEQTLLFSPRQHCWSDHFTWSADGLRILGLTATGRATVTTLALNRERIIGIRASDRIARRHPPLHDPIQSAIS